MRFSSRSYVFQKASSQQDGTEMVQFVLCGAPLVLHLPCQGSYRSSKAPLHEYQVYPNSSAAQKCPVKCGYIPAPTPRHMVSPESSQNGPHSISQFQILPAACKTQSDWASAFLASLPCSHQPLSAPKASHATSRICCFLCPKCSSLGSGEIDLFLPFKFPLLPSHPL